MELDIDALQMLPGDESDPAYPCTIYTCFFYKSCFREYTNI